jgi:hypothetical protein
VPERRWTELLIRGKSAPAQRAWQSLLTLAHEERAVAVPVPPQRKASSKRKSSIPKRHEASTFDYVASLRRGAVVRNGSGKGAARVG